MPKRFIKIISIILIAGFIIPMGASLVLAQGENPPAPQTSSQPATSQTPGQTTTGSTPSSQPTQAPGTAAAQNAFGSGTRYGINAILFAASMMSKLVTFFLSWVIYFEAKILDFLMTQFNFSTEKVVVIGWGIVRDFANMAFILALVIIAISTIIGYKSYAYEQMLWRVIVGALLVNFSLVIGGVIVDAGNYVAYFFLQQVTRGGGIEFSARLANALAITSFYNAGTGSISLLSVFTKATATLAVSAAGIILNMVAVVVMAFVFGMAAVYLVIRVIHLWGLLIAAPGAFAAFAFPGQTEHLSKWLKSVLDWAFFLPIFVFFIYLTLLIFDANGNIAQNTFNATAPIGWNQPIAYTASTAPSAILQYIFVISLLVAGLHYAKSTAKGVSESALKTLSSWGTKTTNFAGRQLRRTAMQAMAPLPPSAPKPTGVRGLLSRAGSAVGTAAVAIPGLRGYYLEQAAAEKKTTDEYKGEIKDVPTDYLINTLKTSPTLIGRRKLAYAEALAEKGKLSVKDAAGNAVFGDQFLGEMLKMAQREGREKNILNVAPDLAGLIGKSVADATKKISAGKAENIREEAFGYRNTAAGNKPEVLLNLSGGHLDRIAKEGSPELRNEVKDSIERAFNDIGANVITGLSPQETDKILNLAIHTQTSPLWNI